MTGRSPYAYHAMSMANLKCRVTTLELASAGCNVWLCHDECYEHCHVLSNLVLYHSPCNAHWSFCCYLLETNNVLLLHGYLLDAADPYADAEVKKDWESLESSYHQEDSCWVRYGSNAVWRRSSVGGSCTAGSQGSFADHAWASPHHPLLGLLQTHWQPEWPTHGLHVAHHQVRLAGLSNLLKK